MRAALVLIMSFFMAVAHADSVSSSGDDWRKSESAEERQEKLVKLVQGTSHWMVEMGERYQNLYWAAKQKKWEFAQYQVEEMESLMKTVAIARPKRAKTAEEFMEVAFEPLELALVSQNAERFNKAFQQLRSECIACHHKNDHGFVVIPSEPQWAPSPVLNVSR